MTTKELYLYAVDQATDVVNQVAPEEFEQPTPCTEWDVHMLLSHMLYELAWAADIVSGKTIEEVGDAYEGDLIQGDAQRSWRRYELATRQSVNAASVDVTVHLSNGDRTLDDYLLEGGNDLLIHAWDLGQAIDIDVVFDPEVARRLYIEAKWRQKELTASGLYAPPVEVPEDSSTQTKLLALLGRSENWANL